jgi:1-acyl-sn-glycerol-3-phosphate acyltransferase
VATGKAADIDTDKDGDGAAKPHHFLQHPERHLSLRLLKFIDVVFSRVYHKVTVLSPPRLPEKGPAILISNHTSGLDPLLIQSVCKRVIVWMMAEEYYQIPALRPIFKTLEAIPVDRRARDSGAMRLALRALREGRILGVFPEGRIETTRALLPFQPGAVQMATKTGVPVYPVFLDGTQHGVDEMVPAFLHRQDATLRFGPAVKLERATPPREAAERLRGAVAALNYGSPWERRWSKGIAAESL